MNISIFEYSNPSLFLRDTWNSKRAYNKNFTLRAWATQLGISSHGSFYQMIKGLRPLPKKYIHPISKSLKLGSKETLYFETLVDYSKAKDLEHKNFYKDRLKELSPSPKLSFYELESFHFIKNPLNGAIIEMTTLSDFKYDIKWIQDKLAIKYSQNEIQKAINLLLELKLITLCSDGKLKRSNAHIFTKQDIKNIALQEYHSNVLSLANSAIKTQEIDKREFNATAFGIKEEHLPQIKEDIRNFINEMINKYETTAGSADQIYQLSTQFFGLTK